MPDMLEPKSSFGQFAANQVIFIAGGTNSENFALSSV